MEKISRNVYDYYDMLTDLAKSLVEYFKKTRNEDLYIDVYKFCNFLYENEAYEFAKVYESSPWEHIVWHNGVEMNEEELHELVCKFDFIKNPPRFTKHQIGVISYALKYFANISGFFFDEDGILQPHKKVKLPNSEIKTSPEEIMKIRSVLKQMRKKHQIKKVQEQDTPLTVEFLLKNGFKKDCMGRLIYRTKDDSVYINFEGWGQDLLSTVSHYYVYNGYKTENTFTGYITTTKQLQDVLNACGINKKLV